MSLGVRWRVGDDGQSMSGPIWFSYFQIDSFFFNLTLKMKKKTQKNNEKKNCCALLALIAFAWGEVTAGSKLWEGGKGNCLLRVEARRCQNE